MENQIKKEKEVKSYATRRYLNKNKFNHISHFGFRLVGGKEIQLKYNK